VEVIFSGKSKTHSATHERATLWTAASEANMVDNRAEFAEGGWGAPTASWCAAKWYFDSAPGSDVPVPAAPVGGSGPWKA
jgi:hypothetical protein